jgi:hypothetical protein
MGVAARERIRSAGRFILLSSSQTPRERRRASRIGARPFGQDQARLDRNRDADQPASRRV